jgi:predicted alpha/beta-hydrolase family hydrolase
VECQVLMLPGFGGRADQQVLVRLDHALGDRGVTALRAALPPGRPSPGLVREVELARTLRTPDRSFSAYAGRSFGGRVLARLALETRPRALLLLGFPIRSATGRRRPEDEAVLTQLACPTLIVQGSADPLGPVRTFERLMRRNPLLELQVVRGASHAFGGREREAIDCAADWLALRLR